MGLKVVRLSKEELREADQKRIDKIRAGGYSKTADRLQAKLDRKST